MHNLKNRGGEDIFERGYVSKMKRVLLKTSRLQILSHRVCLRSCLRSSCVILFYLDLTCEGFDVLLTTLDFIFFIIESYMYV